MFNSGCPDEMGIWAEKTFQDGVGIIYSLAKHAVKLMGYGA